MLLNPLMILGLNCMYAFKLINHFVPRGLTTDMARSNLTVGFTWSISYELDASTIPGTYCEGIL